MKKIILLSLFSLGLLISPASFAQELDSAKTISIQKFVKKAKHPNKNLVLDVRTPDETKEGHIEGALFADFWGDGFSEEIEKLDKSKTYLVYCKSGIRSQKAANQMKELGFKKVYTLAGGLNAWQKEGKPIVK